MDYLHNFKYFEEVNPKDIAMIQDQMDNYFTISFELEIETDDRTNFDVKFQEYDDYEMQDVITMTLKDMSIRKKSEKNLVIGLAYDLYDEIESGSMSIFKFEKMFDPGMYHDDRISEIVGYMRSSIKSIIYEENFNYLKNNVSRYLPNFWNKWADDLDIVDDATLDRGVEIKPRIYVDQISKSLEIINDFYSDLNSQDYWKFSERTGIHINIGIDNSDVEWNPIKGLLLLNDYRVDDRLPYVFKDMSWRLNSTFCKSLMPYLIEMDPAKKNKLKSIDFNDVKSIENILNGIISKKVNEMAKNFGFNISKLPLGYVEFRYAGGDIPKDVLIEKIKYFTFIVYLMTDINYKRKEYIKKLYKFIDNL